MRKEARACRDAAATSAWGAASRLDRCCRSAHTPTHRVS